MFTQTGAILLDFEFFSTRFFANRVVVVTRFFTNEVQYFKFLFTFTLFGHRHSQLAEGLPVFFEPRIVSKTGISCKAFFGISAGGPGKSKKTERESPRMATPVQAVKIWIMSRKQLLFCEKKAEIQLFESVLPIPDVGQPVNQSMFLRRLRLNRLRPPTRLECRGQRPTGFDFGDGLLS